MRFATKYQPRANAPDAKQPTTAAKSAKPGTGRRIKDIVMWQKKEELEK